VGTPPSGSGLASSVIELGLEPSSVLTLETTLNTHTLSGIVFDQYDAQNFKFAAIDPVNDRVVIGYHTPRGWTTVASIARVIHAGVDYKLGVSLQGTTVSVTLDGQQVLGHAFNSFTVAGEAGLFSRNGSASFDDVLVQTNDPKFLDGEGLGGQPALPGDPVENRAPVAVDDQAQTLINTPVAIDVLANDTDADGDELFVAELSDPEHGSVFVNSEGMVLYTPVDGFVGTDSFTYRASDGTDLSNEATVIIEVIDSENRAPVAEDDFAETGPDTPVTINVLANDFDPDGDDLTVIIVSEPESGTIVENEDQTVTYTPNAGFIGTDSFTYKVSDGMEESNVATVFIEVGLVENRPPVAVDDHAETGASAPVVIDVLANDSDPDGDELFVAEFSQPAHGTVELNPDGAFTYTPDEGFAGTDSFTYRASDGVNLSRVATVTVEVLGEPVVNTPPVAVDDHAETAAGAPVVIDVLANDFDEDGDELVVVDLTQPAHGTVVLNADGAVTYTPEAGFSGADSFTYRAFDGADKSEIATVTVQVIALVLAEITYTSPYGPQNIPDRGVLNSVMEITDAHAIVNLQVLLDITHGRNSDLLVYLVSPSGTRVELVSGLPRSGRDLTGTVLSDDAELSILQGTAPYTGAYRPVGELSVLNGELVQGAWTLEVHDLAAGQTGALNHWALVVTVEVIEQPIVNTAPVAVDDHAETTAGVPVVIDVLANDFDQDGDELSVVDLTQPENGSVTLNTDGSVTYTPDEGFEGTDTFTYRAFDGADWSDPATVTVEVIAAPVEHTPPVAVDDHATTEAGVPVVIAVLANDFDEDGDELSVVDLTQPENGSVTLNADGSVTYTPDEGFTGIDSFTYRVSDGTAESNLATVTVQVNAPAPQVSIYTSPHGTQDIPDRGVLLSDIVIADSFSILDVNVQLDITHGRNSDLVIYLVGPDGTRVELVSGLPRNSKNLTNTTLDDDADLSIREGSAPYSGSFRPIGDLSQFEGMLVTGTWTLEVHDIANGQTGALNNWSLIFEH
jgi:large repetitive protein